MKEQRRRTTADGSANSCAVVVRRWSVVERRKKQSPLRHRGRRVRRSKLTTDEHGWTRMNRDKHGAFLAPSALFGAAWAARRKASQPLALIHILLNSKLKTQNLQLPRLSSARPFASPRPSGFRKAPPSTTHLVSNTPNSKLKTLNSKPWHAPLFGNAGGVGPIAASGFGVRHAPSTKVRVGAVRLAFLALGPTAPGRPPFGRRDRLGRRCAGERGGGLVSLRNAACTMPLQKLFWTGVSFELRK
jgi:hypothetical protein